MGPYVRQVILCNVIDGRQYVTRQPSGPDPTDSPGARFRELLGEAGLNLVTVLAVDELPTSLSEAIRSDAARAGMPGDSGLRVVVVGNFGAGLLESFADGWKETDDPVDRFSATRVMAALRETGPGIDSRLLYPGDCGFSLQRLGEVCGWGGPSWLGVSIHPVFGTWFAFRAVAVTAAPLAVATVSMSTDVCLSCRTRDCLAACPVDAPGPPGQFDLEVCVSHRMQPGSGCATRCLAREHCPVGEAYRYPKELIGYFYSRSLAALRRWFAQCPP